MRSSCARQWLVVAALVAALLRHGLIPAADSNNVVQTRKDSQGNYIVGFTGPSLNVPAGAQAETSAVLYAGPKIQSELENPSRRVWS